jgi:glycosyltransferase involved in cell wall biosynthesis
LEHANAEGLVESARQKQFRLAVTMPNFRGGGMERMRLHLVQEWARRGITIDLVVSSASGPLRKLVPSGVAVHEIAKRHPAVFPLGLARYLHQHRPTHLLASAQDIVFFALLVGAFGYRIPTVVSFHNHLSSEFALAKGAGSLKLRLLLLLLARTLFLSQRIVCVSKGVADDLAQRFPGVQERLRVIYNPVITPDTRLRAKSPLVDCPVPVGQPWLLYVGRLVSAKGLDLLLASFRRLAADDPALHLVLLGEGPLEAWVREQATAAGLAERVHLPGFQENPLPWMRQASAVVLPSRHEGLPNVLIEALYCGALVIATDCPSGPAEILGQGRFGRLVPIEDVPALTDGLREYRRPVDVEERALWRRRAEEFTVEVAADAYLSALLCRDEIAGPMI